MTSIFPPSEAGGLIVRDPNTGAQINQPNTDNVDVPNQLVINCDFTALPNDCRARVTPEQINAIVSELMNFYVAMAPTREWDCSALDNLKGAFQQFVTDLMGEGGGSSFDCASLQVGNPQFDPQTYLIYCDGGTIKKWSIHDSNGVVEFVLDTVCGVPNGEIISDDYLLYCRQGKLQKGSALGLNIYTGNWVQARSYVPNNMVQKDGKLYSPNAVIPTGTAFVVGTTGATWREVSQTMFPAYDPSLGYPKDTIVNRMGKFYAANNDIPPGTAFTIGTTGATWREIDFNNISINDFDQTKSYKKFNVVIKDSQLYRARADIVPGPMTDQYWEKIGNDRSQYRGPWVQALTYLKDDVVEKDNKIWAANSLISGQAFVVGTINATWREISPSDGDFYWKPNFAYSANKIVAYEGNIFLANSNGVAANVPPTPANVIPSNPNFWRPYALPIIVPLFSDTKAYVAGEIFVQQKNAYPERSIWRTIADRSAAGFSQYSGFEEVGERNKFRGMWNVQDKYLYGDIVTRSTDNPYGSLYEANSNIPAGTAFVESQFGANTFRRLSGGSAGVTIKEYDQTKAYNQGDFVATRFGLYKASAQIPANTPFYDGNGLGSWLPFNSGRPIQTFPTEAQVSMNSNHRNATLAFTRTAVQTYVVSDSSGFLPGDTVSGYSTGGQLSFWRTSGAQLRTPDGLSLRNKDYASFMIKCISPTEFLLSGDLQVVP